MPRVEAPPIETQMLDIQLFARAYFNIELTSYQLKFIDAISKGQTLHGGKAVGKTTARKVAMAYLQAGLQPYGRSRIIDRPVPPQYTDKAKFKALTQDGKILQLIKRPGGAMNWELARVSLRYGASVFDLRKDGYNIVTERQYLKNGRASNTYRYRMAGQ